MAGHAAAEGRHALRTPGCKANAAKDAGSTGVLQDYGNRHRRVLTGGHHQQQSKA